MVEQPKVLLDPYLAWTEREGVPVIEDFGIDLLAMPTAHWPRFDVGGGIAHLKGRGDFISVFVLDLAPAANTSPQKHLYEEVIYVLSGYGSTTVETTDGRRHSFEWGPKSLFALPLNARYQHFNTSGREHARLAATNNLCLQLNLFHNEAFVFDNPFAFPERLGQFSGEGDVAAVRPERNMWETNFVPDLSAFDRGSWADRDIAESGMTFILADGTMHAHTAQMPVGRYNKGHRHGPDFHVFPVTGHGYSLLWHDLAQDLVRVDWKHGVAFAPPDQMFHQNFNTSPQPARYLAVALGGLRYPLTASQRRIFIGDDFEGRSDGCQIDYADQDPRIHRIYLDELAKHGVGI